MNKWIKAFRLRTLPLALSFILMLVFVAYQEGFSRWYVMTLPVFTITLLQILSNLANDYGDFTKGTDNENRLGPERSLQSGSISEKGMKNAIILFVILSLLSGITLVLRSFGLENVLKSLLFIAIGIFAILAAIQYTVGKSAYGYSGWGDLFVFIFFGWVAVLGSYYLISMEFAIKVILPATTMGLFSTAILNLNNLRDHKNDEASGKVTLVVKMSFKRAKIYHLSLLLFGWLSFILFLWINNSPQMAYLELLALPLFIRNGLIVFRVKEEQKLDPELKNLALSITLFTLLYGIGLYLL